MVCSWMNFIMKPMNKFCRSCTNYISLEEDDGLWTCKFCEEQLKKMCIDTPMPIPHLAAHAQAGDFERVKQYSSQPFPYEGKVALWLLLELFFY